MTIVAFPDFYANGQIIAFSDKSFTIKGIQNKYVVP